MNQLENRAQVQNIAITTENFVKKINKMLVVGIILSNLFLIAFVIFFSIDNTD